ncbi:metabotropic glycine receptor-like [Syngnathoides biaculeatus]|uniref:metabotropic glycine receptor-like n=1 Tax=Syngnathoides biaculeatus TaxID=300417 RepID=UPI002ADD428D|nr:metabotropic glycine receptor-like [Syngnathoides biaculeatus]
MALLVLLLQTGLVWGSNYGYVEWSENHRDEKPWVLSTTQSVDTTERAVLAHKIEEDLPRVVTAFLHSGDPSALRGVKCSRRYELSSLRGGPHVASHYSLHAVLESVTRAANFLNSVLQANSSRGDSSQRDLRWYRALVRTVLEGDPKIHRAALSVGGDSHVLLQATRSDKEVLLRESASPDQSDWVNGRGPDPSTGVHLLDKKQIRWSAPYLECDRGAFVPFWLLTLSADFYGRQRDSTLEFRGAVRVDVNLQDADIDQCSDSGWFAGTHRCNLTSMECSPIAGHGFVLDKYKCRCRRGFYHPSRAAPDGFQTADRGAGEDDPSDGCLPCRAGCAYCRDDTPCLARRDGGLRLAAASFQSLCVLLDLAGMVALYHVRRRKSIRTSGFILLEAILLGALLLYFPVLILYFHPSVFRCILLRWVRLLGFAIMYGTVVLKLYRVLKVFLSRTAQRTPYMTSWRVLRMLTVILLAVLWFLVAWTSAVCQNPEPSRALIAAGLSSEGLQFSVCLLDRWDYMMALAELLFLLWGVYLCYAVRTIHSAFHEPRYMTVAVYNELLLSAVFHLIRFSVAPGLHPDWMLMLIFAHTHLTVTVTVGVLLVPKFLSKGPQTRDDVAAETYEEELDMGRSASYLNNSITSAWSEHSLDPDDIRDELKKLYAQLEVYKRKKMLANNPHLQKKRNSKKGLGRTLMKRIAEIPESVHLHRRCSREDGSEHGTLRRNHTETAQRGKPQEDSLKNKVLGLQKSLSYDHVCEQDDETASRSGSAAGDKITPAGNGGESSLLGSLIGRRHCKKQPEAAGPPPEPELARSAQSVPLFWKSASVHNLTHEKKPAQLRTSIMQKSLSVIASAKEKMPALGNKTQSAEDAGKKALKGKEARTLSEVDETPEHYPKMIVSQSVDYSKTPMKTTGIMKQQVSGSQPSICSETGRNLYDVSEVGPWEAEEAQTPSEAKTQKHVSIAPQQTDAGRRGSGASGLGKRSRSQQRPKTGQSPSNRRRSKDGGGQRDESRETRKSRGPRSPLPLKPDVSAWDFDEQPMLVGLSESISPERIRRKKSVTPTDGKPKALHSDHSKSTGSLLQPPSSMVEICPWDYSGPPSPKQEKTSGSPATHKKKRKASCSSNPKADKEKGREKTRERRSSSGKPPSERRRLSRSSECGAPVSERRRSSGKNPEGAEVRRAQGISRDAQVSNGSFARTKTSGDGEKDLHHKAAVAGAPEMADVCPWDSEDRDPAERA